MRQRINDVFESLGERESGVMRLRFGFNEDERSHTLQEIGEVYGISSDRVRHIIIKTMIKLRRSVRARLLREFMQPIENALVTPIHSGDRLRTGRTRIGKVAPRDSIADSDTDDWELSEIKPDVEDTAPPRQLERGTPEYDTVTTALVKILTSKLYNYQTSFATAVQTPYPQELYRQIEAELGSSLTPQHLEDFWNHYYGHLRHELLMTLDPDTISFERISKLVSALLSSRMRDGDVVYLNISPVQERDGASDYLGAWAKRGEITITGNPGNYVGYKMSQAARINVIGTAGHYAGLQASGNASLNISGAAGDYLGKNARGSALIEVTERAGDNPADNIRGQARVIVNGRVYDAPAIAQRQREMAATTTSENETTVSSLDDKQLCQRLEVTPKSLQRYKVAAGYPAEASLYEADVTVLLAAFPELSVPKSPPTGYISVSEVMQRLGYRGTAAKFAREAAKTGFAIYEFRDEENTPRMYMRTVDVL